MTNPSKRSSFILTLVMIMHLSCSDRAKNEQQDIATIQTFSIDEANREWEKLNQLQGWKFLQETAGTSFENLNDVDNWLLEKTKALFSYPKLIPAEEARKLMDELYHSSYRSSAVEFAEQLLNHPQAESFLIAKGIAAALLMNHYSYLNQLDSIEKYRIEMELGLMVDTTQWLKIEWHNALAKVANLKGNFFEAARNYHHAIDLTDSTQKENLGILHMNLSMMYLNLNHFDGAYTYMQEFLNAFEEDNFPIEYINNIAIIQSKAEDNSGAEKTFKRAIEVAQKTENANLLAQTLSNYANFKSKLGEYEEALKLMAKSDSICKHHEISIGVVINQINRGHVYLHQGEWQAALSELQAAENVMPKFENLSMKIEVYEHLTSVFDSIQNEEKANYYYRLASSSGLKHRGDLPRSVIAEWQLSRERELNLYRTAKLEIQLQQKRLLSYIVGLIASLVVLSFLIYGFMQRRKNEMEKEKLLREKQKIAYDLELKSKELIADSLRNLSIQQTKSLIGEQLQERVEQLPVVHQTRFNSLLKELKMARNDNSMHEFETRFAGVYESFYQQLKAIAPDITPNEIRVSALMRLNLSTKEIAMLTNRTTGTIDNIRSSLRKKLNLDDKRNLQDFLMKM